MTMHYRTYADLVLQTISAVGDDQLDLAQAIARLEDSGVESCELTGITEIWQVTQESNKVLAILFPEYREIFGGRDPRTPSKSPQIPLQVSIKILVRQVMSGVQTLHPNPKQRQCAERILANYPSPFPESSSPFVDTKGIWDHTHGAEDES